MARTTSTGNYLSSESVAVASPPPLTLSCWLYIPAFSSTFFVAALGRLSGANNSHAIRIISGQVQAFARLGSTEVSWASAAGTASTDTWFHVAAVFVSPTERYAYRDGGNQGSDFVSVSPGAPTHTWIGANGATNPLAGRICEVGVWDAALSPAEVAALGRGVALRLIRPANLAGYWPVWGVDDPEPDLSGSGGAMVLTGTPPAVHHAPVALRWPSFLSELEVEDDGLAVGTSAGQATVAGNGSALASAQGAAAGQATVAGVLESDISGAVLVLPNTVLASSNLQDSNLVSPPERLEDLYDDPSDADENWWTAVNPTLATDLRLGFFSPGHLWSDGTGWSDGTSWNDATSWSLVNVQHFSVLLRKTAGESTPTVNIELWEDGEFVSTLLADEPITSTVGEEVMVPWDIALLSDPTGKHAEIRIVGTPVGATFSPADFGLQWSHPEGGATITTGAYEQWDDETMNGNHWVQATAANRPAEATVNGIRVVDFDGVDNFMTNVSQTREIWTQDVDEDCEFTVVFKLDAHADNAVIFSIPLSSNHAVAVLRFSLSSNDRHTINYRNNASGGSAIQSANGQSETTSWHYIRVIKDGGTLSAFHDGDEFANSPATNARVLMVDGADGAAVLAIGARGDGTLPTDVKIADVAIYKTLLTTGQRADDNDRLAALVTALNAT